MVQEGQGPRWSRGSLRESQCTVTSEEMGPGVKSAEMCTRGLKKSFVREQGVTESIQA